MIHEGREGEPFTCAEPRGAEQEEEGGKGKKTRRNTGVEGGRDTRQLNTTADEAALPVRSRDGLRSPQCEVVAWICWWRGGGFSGVGAEGREQSLRAPLAPNTEAPEGWATRVCGEAGGGWRAGAPAMAGMGGAACLLPLAPGVGQPARVLGWCRSTSSREREKKH